jgi:uncharacterized protein YehS (DUF1456 family)
MEKINNNEVLRNIWNSLDICELEMGEIFKMGGYSGDEETIKGILNKDNEKGCSDEIMESFLEGLIVYRRGPSEKKSEGSEERQKLTNNMILKKLRIAFDLKGEDMIDVFAFGEMEITKDELNNLFRKSSHAKYKECSNRHLRAFLKGINFKIGEE